MDERHWILSDLFVSISGVLIFLSVNHLVDLNGYTKYSYLLFAFGLLLLIFHSRVAGLFKQSKVISNASILTLSHVLIFLGLKEYLGSIEEMWWIYLLIGLILLNYNRTIARWF